jgi:hypothetical protein
VPHAEATEIEESITFVSPLHVITRLKHLKQACCFVFDGLCVPLQGRTMEVLLIKEYAYKVSHNSERHKTAAPRPEKSKLCNDCESLPVQ